MKITEQGKNALFGLGLVAAMAIGTVIGISGQQPLNAESVVTTSPQILTKHDLSVVTVEVPVEKIVEKLVEVPSAPQIITEYIEVPSAPEIVTVTDQGAIDAAYASGYTTAEEQMNRYYASAEDDAYNRGVERGGAWEHEAYTLALSTPCAVEDSDNCYWNAQTMGNGLGTSFVNVAGIIYHLN